MNLTLHDSKQTLPDDLQASILVFTGFVTDRESGVPAIVTEVHCSYFVGGQHVEYKRNSDASAQRFEDALQWAVEQAGTVGVSEIHAVFELNRPIEPRFLRRVCPRGFTDRRRRANAAAGGSLLLVPVQSAVPARKQPANTSALRRRYVFRNKVEKANEERYAIAP